MLSEPINPGGTASYGAVIFQRGQRLWEASEIFNPDPLNPHSTSNNLAEYCGFNAILLYLLKNSLDQKDVTIYGDSKLVIEQQFGTNGKRWRINKGVYVPHALRAQELLKQFPYEKIHGIWIPRELNTIADELSKACLKKAGIELSIQPEK